MSGFGLPDVSLCIGHPEGSLLYMTLFVSKFSPSLPSGPGLATAPHTITCVPLPPIHTFLNNSLYK